MNVTAPTSPEVEACTTHTKMTQHIQSSRLSFVTTTSRLWIIQMSFKIRWAGFGPLRRNFVPYHSIFPMGREAVLAAVKWPKDEWPTYLNVSGMITDDFDLPLNPDPAAMPSLAEGGSPEAKDVILSWVRASHCTCSTVDYQFVRTMQAHPQVTTTPFGCVAKSATLSPPMPTQPKDSAKHCCLEDRRTASFYSALTSS